jgi:hypothetical protein
VTGAGARRHAAGSVTVEYLGVLVAVGVLMLALVSLREHRPERRPPVDPVARVRALVAPARAPRVRRPATVAPRRPRRPAPRAARPTVRAPVWAVGW